MGYTKCLEDALKNRDHNIQIERNWYTEAQNINRVVFSNNPSPKSDRSQTLKSVRQSLQYRLNLSLTASAVKSPLVKGLVFSLKRDMQNILSDLNKELSLCENSTFKEIALSDKEKQEYKKTLILQIFHKTIYSVSNAHIITEKEMSAIIVDLSALALWYKNTDILFGALTFDEKNWTLVNDIVAEEFDSEIAVCKKCGASSPTVFKHCIKCGWNLGGNNEN